MRAPVNPNNLPVGQLVDGWRVVRKLGEGGYGTTYQVEKDGQFFALKLAHHPAQSRDERQTDERTQREIGCLLVLRHRYIVRVWAHGRWPHPKEGYLYIIMDYVEGSTVWQWQEAVQPTAHEVVVLIERVLEAVAAMHAQNVLHRDLKPENILVGKNGEPVLVDYGAAHSPVGPRLTHRPLPPGTPRYTSPEAARFEAVHRRDKKARYEYTVADELYALGVTLYDMLTDPWPVTHPDPQLVGGPFPPALAHQVNERVPVALSLFVAKLVAREPAERPNSAERARRDAAEFAALDAEDWKKRPLHPPVPPELAAASAAPMPWRRPDARGLRLRRPGWRAVGAGLGLGLLMASGVYLSVRGGVPGPPPPPAPTSRAAEGPRSAAEPPRGAPVSASTAPAAPPPPSTPAAPQEKGPIVKARIAPASSEPAVCASKQPPPKGTPAWRSWCQCLGIVGTLTALQAGCSGPQVRPASEPCPQEAVAAAKELVFVGANVCLDQTQTCDWDKYVSLKEGPLTGITMEESGKVPEGSLLFGEMKIIDATKGDMTVRYTLLQLPNGKKYPVCMEKAWGTFSKRPAKAGSVPDAPPIAGINNEPKKGWQKPW